MRLDNAHVKTESLDLLATDVLEDINRVDLISPPVSVSVLEIKKKPKFSISPSNFYLFAEIPIVQMMATEEHDDGYDDPESNQTGGKISNRKGKKLV